MDLFPRERSTADPVHAGAMIRVAIIDDHPLLCDGIRRALNLHDDIQVVGQAHTAADGIELVTDLEPDVALLDYRLPDEDGIAVLLELRRRGVKTQVVILTCHTEEHHVRSAIDGGAVGFLSKASVDTDSLVDAVRSAGAGMSSVSPDVLGSLMRVVRHDLSGIAEELTNREREIWELVSTGMSNGAIASHLCLSERTVKFHVGNLLRKLDVRSRSEATALAYRCGFMTQ